MTRFPRDDNRVPVTGGVSSTDGTTPIPIEVSPTTGELFTSTTIKDSSNNVINPSTSDNQTNGLQVTKLIDEYGNDIEGTMLNQLKVAQSYRLSGGVFNLATLDTNFFTAVTSAGGTATVSGGELTLALTTTSGSYAGIRTNSTARYMGSNMNYYRSVHRVSDLGAANNIRRCGLCDTLPVVEGFFFQLSNTTFQIVSRKAGVDTTVSSGSFNGNGTLSNQSYSLDLSYHTFEIYYTNRRVMFVVDGTPIHTFVATTTTLASTRHFKAFMDSSNAGVGTAVSCLCSSLTVNRYGSQTSQPKSYFQQGTTAGILLKTGIGSIHSMIISGVTNNSVITIYDNTSAAGTVIWSSGAMSNQTVPFDVSFNGSGPTQFENGLFMTVTAANSNVFIKYE